MACSREWVQRIRGILAKLPAHRDGESVSPPRRAEFQRVRAANVGLRSLRPQYRPPPALKNTSPSSIRTKTARPRAFYTTSATAHAASSRGLWAPTTTPRTAIICISIAGAIATAVRRSVCGLDAQHRAVRRFRCQHIQQAVGAFADVADALVRQLAQQRLAANLFPALVEFDAL